MFIVKQYSPMTEARRQCLTPPVDIYETAQEVVVLADMPGVSKEHIYMNVINNQLTISGAFQTDWEGKKLVRELPNCSYYRTFRLSNIIDVENIQAKMTDGVLTVKLPKKQPEQPYKVPIEIE
ncbi:TPA: Hsp20/alpha crystallin family protein [Candidatus Poribacteria bacterium]|nr:Hsp20/alpha crystallin family protein [Candidatus Poribacteria bacterium]